MRFKFDGLWRHRDFVRLWGAETVSVFGSLITHTALPFTAILTLDASTFEVAALAALGIAPALVVGLAAGVWVDRLRKRPLMIAADIGRAALLLTVPLAWAFDALTIEHLYVIAFSTGTLTILFDVAYQAYLPSIVTQDELLEGNSKLTASASVSEFAGFSAAGWLVQLLTGPLAVLVDAATFVVSAIFVRSIETPEPPIDRAHNAPSVLREAADGMRMVGRDPILRSIGTATVLYSLGFGIFASTYLLYVVRELDFDPGVLGMIFGIGGLSSLGGALLAERAAGRLGIGVSMVAGVLMMGVSQLFIPAATGATALGAALLIAQQLTGDGAFTAYHVSEVSLRQSITPERFLGRVGSCMRILQDGFRLGGALLGGLIAEMLGVRGALVVAAGLIIAGGLALAISPVALVRSAAGARRIVVAPVEIEV